MPVQKHLQAEDMQRLLFADTDNVDKAQDEAHQAMADHIESCEECQQALNEMAASPELWDKASEFITDAHLSETIAVDLKNRAANNDRAAQNVEMDSEEDLPWDYPIKHLFDPPSHPEMLGRIGDYDIEREVGRGGMGVVLKAFDHELNRPVAVKVLAPHLAASGAARKRFAREGRAAAAVLHPNVIAIHGVDSTEKTPYIVMPYVGGPSLQKLVDQNGPLELKEMVRITMQIAGGLAAAHSQGVIHRDIKPANVLIEESVSRVVITDFGLARAENDASMTHTGWLAGTPNFMSPEQANGKRVDGRSDLFSLGSVMYFMATGRMPFRADAAMAVLNRICTDEPTPVRQVNADVSRTFAEIVEKLHRKDPEERFQSAGELHETLEQYLAYLHQPDVSKPPTINEKPKSNVWAWLATGAACIAIFALTLAVSQNWFAGKPVGAGPEIEKILDTTAGSTSADGAGIAMSIDDASIGAEENLAESLNATESATDSATVSATVNELPGMQGASDIQLEYESKLESIIERYSLVPEMQFEFEANMIESELNQMKASLELLGPLSEDK